jgi:hypothetical protein
MVHLAIQDKENALLGPDVHLQHCRGISFDEARILAETGTNVRSAPGFGQARFSVNSKGNTGSTPTDYSGITLLISIGLMFLPSTAFQGLPSIIQYVLSNGLLVVAGATMES